MIRWKPQLVYHSKRDQNPSNFRITKSLWFAEAAYVCTICIARNIQRYKSQIGRPEMVETSSSNPGAWWSSLAWNYMLWAYHRSTHFFLLRSGETLRWLAFTSVAWRVKMYTSNTCWARSLYRRVAERCDRQKCWYFKYLVQWILQRKWLGYNRVLVPLWWSSFVYIATEDGRLQSTYWIGRL